MNLKGSSTVTVLGLVVLILTPEALSQSCGGTITLSSSNPTQTFSSPNYPGNSGDVRCTWTINAPTAESIRLNCPVLIAPQLWFFCLSYQTYTAGGSTFIYCGSRSTDRTDSVKTTTFRHVGRFTWFFSSSFTCTVSFTPESNPVSCPVDCGLDNLQAGKGTRIVGGETTTENGYPWIVALRSASNDFQFCGGTLISREWVLTAAHCVDSMVQFPTSLKLSLGDHDKYDTSGNEIHILAQEIIVHENWDSELTRNDIALVRIDPVTISTIVRPICLPLKGRTISGEKGTVIGWGTTAFQGSSSNVLLKVEMDLLTASQCRAETTSGYAFYITDDMICATNGGTGGSCQGDSGGPLFLKKDGRNFLKGIVSFGVRCAEENYPGAFTFVDNYVDWIKTRTGETFCER